MHSKAPELDGRSSKVCPKMGISKSDLLFFILTYKSTYVLIFNYIIINKKKKKKD